MKPSILRIARVASKSGGAPEKQIPIGKGLVVILAASAFAGLVGTAQAQNPNSLWLGTDNTGSRNVLNTDRSGTVLRTVGPVESTGFAIDLAGNAIYFGTSGGTITPRDLTTLAPGASFNPGTSFGEDMTFDGTEIWRSDLGAGLVRRINPSTKAIDFSFSPGFGPLGVAWDGSDLWVSQFGFGGRVEKFTPTGTDTGQGFNVSGGIEAGGLGFDTTDNTLWLGSFGNVYHYTLTGTLLGSFGIPASQDASRFVDGLEFEGAPRATVPDASSTAVLLGSGLSVLFAFRRLRRA